METDTNRKRRRESPPSTAQNSPKNGDSDKSSVRCASFIKQGPATGLNKGTVPPPKRTRTEEGSLRSPNTLSNTENGIRQRSSGAGNPLDPRIRRQTKLQNGSAPGSQSAKTTDENSHLHDFQRSMQNLSSLESQRVTKHYLYRSAQKKLKEKQEAFEKVAAHLNNYPDMRRKREREIQNLQDEVNELKRSCQKINSELESEKEKFNKSVARLEENAKPAESSRREERSPAEQEEIKALKEQVKTLKEDLKSQASRSDTLSNRVTTLDKNFTTQHNALSDNISAKVTEVFETIKSYMGSSDAKIQTLEEQARSVSGEMARIKDGVKNVKSQVEEFIEERQGRDEGLNGFLVENLSKSKAEAKVAFDEFCQAITKKLNEQSKSLETLRTSVPTNADTAAAKASLEDLNKRVAVVESKQVNDKPPSGPSNEDLDHVIKENKQLLSAVQTTQDKLNIRVRTVETDLNSRVIKANDAALQIETVTKRLDGLATSVTEMQNAIDGGGNGPGLASVSQILDTKLDGAIENFQELQRILLDKDFGEVPTMQQNQKILFSRLGKLESSAGATRQGVTTSSSRATSQEVGSPRISNGTVSGAFEQGNVDEKIASAITTAVKPLQDKIQTQQTDLARFQTLDLDLNRILTGLGLGHIRHPDGSVSVQTNGNSIMNGIQYAHIPQSKAEEIEQKIHVLQLAVQDLTRQHQNLTTTEMSKTIVKTVEQMYPNIFPATQQEIGNLRNDIHFLNVRINGADNEVEKLNSVVEGVNGVAQHAAKNADEVSTKLDEVHLAYASAKEDIEHLKSWLDAQSGAAAGVGGTGGADSRGATSTQTRSLADRITPNPNTSRDRASASAHDSDETEVEESVRETLRLFKVRDHGRRK